MLCCPCTEIHFNFPSLVDSEDCLYLRVRCSGQCEIEFSIIVFRTDCLSMFGITESFLAEGNGYERPDDALCHTSSSQLRFKEIIT